MQEDVRNALAIVDGMKMTTKRNTESLNELSENYNNTASNYENLINEIQRKSGRCQRIKKACYNWIIIHFQLFTLNYF